VLAKPETATDTDYQGIESVIGHEYFHNWTGDRVTCRDWFQLSLKEGLTVYRDQEFSADQGSRAVRRIGDVRRLRAAQFPEDAGPLAHPVQPKSYLRIDNFYTATVYNKGAEVVRMIETIVGRDGFRKGMDLYFKRHDNHAVTIEDFVAAMQDANGVDLARFRRWYHQAGTPEITVSDRYDPARKTYELTLRQETPPTPGQPLKEPLVVPVAAGFVGPDGGALAAKGEGDGAAAGDTRVLLLTEPQQTFRFTEVAAPPVPSLFRRFSAPVRLKGLGLERLKFLARHDSDPFSRWESAQQVATTMLLDMVAAIGRGGAPGVDPELVAEARAAVGEAARDPAYAAELLSLPSEAYLADQLERVDVDAIHAAREAARVAIARGLAAEFARLHDSLADSGPYRIDGLSIGKRRLRNTALSYLAVEGDDGGVRRAKAQFDTGGNMTDVLAALAVLADLEHPARMEALERFYARWAGDDLVIDKWFALQAMSRLPSTLARVRELARHPAFDRKVPNRIRALVSAFAEGNQVRFHDRSGAGYDFLADEVMALDPKNPLLAARMLQPLGHWRRHDSMRQGLMRGALERVLALPGLSKNTYEIATKSLAEPA
jgi:aminopeptidase N